jgi:3-oxoacyl-[acyl-carrier-protein] synthase-3
VKTSLVATGSYVPGPPIANSALTQFPAARLPLIEQKTGIQSRHYISPGESTSDLAFYAAARCLESCKIKASELDAIILATSTPDRLIPATAPLIQHRLGAGNAYAFDLNSVCSGSIFALHMADCMISSGAKKRVLVVAADTYSRFLDPKDFSTRPYFGDGAAAALLVAAPDEDGRGILGTYLRSDGSGADLIQIPAGGSRLPASPTVHPNDLFFKMNGRAVYEFAVDRGTEAVQKALAQAGLEPSAIDWLVPHQANKFICEEIARRCDVPLSRLVMNLQQKGNTASASPLLALDEARRSSDGSDKTICLVAFGGGLSYGAIILRS